MADLMGGGGPASNGNGIGSARSTPGRSAVASPFGVRGPKAIMQQRAEREARQREERERWKRDQESAPTDAQEVDRRVALQAAERRTANTGAGLSSTGLDQSTSQRPGVLGTNRASTGNGGRAAGTMGIPSRVQASTSQAARIDPATSKPAQGPIPPVNTVPSSGMPLGSQQQAQTGEVPASASRPRHSFPHAFERWETLSAHWEGLTSFWIRRLEENSSELQRDPITQQLSRQVTDLSSAGANLFHAVVELQRLRASSERKFQRWFYDTREELEQSKELVSMMDAALAEERRKREDVVRKAAEDQKEHTKLLKQVAELRKELTISKEEARRAWEELGRREQEERDRTNSLQLGQPTIVGGVQVVPMTQGVSRGSTQRETRYTQPDMHDPYGSPHSASASVARPDLSQAPAVQPVPTSGGLAPPMQPSSVHHQESYASDVSMSEEEFESEPQHAVGQADSVPQPSHSPAVDYTGSGYTPTGWGDMPRHHHPTRLSDVLEEDEEPRSRNSQSQLSRY